MNVLSRILTSGARREGIMRNLIVSPAHFRAISSSTGIDQYLAPYPSLPKAEPKEPGSPTPIATPPSPTSPITVSPTTGPQSEWFKNLLTRQAFAPERSASDRWISVHEGVLRELKMPGNVYTGRSVPINERVDVPSAYRRLHAILSRNRVRSELFLQRRYEKPSDKERRLKSERHRRRFAAWIRKKVQLVSEIRRRG